jgi:hypothetical protein
MDEILIGCQMTALYRCGRISEALSLFRKTRNQLVEDQGTEPGRALMDLHHRILRQDPGLSVRPTRITPVLDRPPVVRLTALFKPSSQRRRALGALLDHDLATADLLEAAEARARLRATCLAPDQPAHLGPADPSVASALCSIGAYKADAIGPSCLPGHRL